MKKLLFLSIFAVLTAISWVACSKEDTTTTTKSVTTEAKVQVIDGTLHFENDIHFYAELERLKKMSADDFRTWESNMGFKSQGSLVEDVQEKLGTVNSKEEYEQIIASNSDIIELKNELPMVKNHFRSLERVLDRNGNVYVNSMLYNYSNGGEIIIKSGDKSLLKNISFDMKTDEDRGILLFPIDKDNSRTACGVSNGGEFTNAAQDRRAVLSAFTNRVFTLNPIPSTTGENLYFVKCFTSIKGTPYKKNIFGNWKTYSTANNLTSIFGVATFDLNFQPFVTVPNFSHTYTNNWDYIDDGGIHLEKQNVPQSQLSGMDIRFSYMSPVKYGHQGTNGNFVTLICQ